MNERIKELARQAGLIAPYGSDREGLRDFDYREFAELIVRECATIADIEKSNLAGCGYITKTKGMLIREHFGVEE